MSRQNGSFNEALLAGAMEDSEEMPFGKGDGITGLRDRVIRHMAPGPGGGDAF